MDQTIIPIKTVNVTLNGLNAFKSLIDAMNSEPSVSARKRKYKVGVQDWFFVNEYRKNDKRTPKGDIIDEFLSILDSINIVRTDLRNSTIDRFKEIVDKSTKWIDNKKKGITDPSDVKIEIQSEQKLDEKEAEDIQKVLVEQYKPTAQPKPKTEAQTKPEKHVDPNKSIGVIENVLGKKPQIEEKKILDKNIKEDMSKATKQGSKKTTEKPIATQLEATKQGSKKTTEKPIATQLEDVMKKIEKQKSLISSNQKLLKNPANKTENRQQQLQNAINVAQTNLIRFEQDEKELKIKLNKETQNLMASEYKEILKKVKEIDKKLADPAKGWNENILRAQRAEYVSNMDNIAKQYIGGERALRDRDISNKKTFITKTRKQFDKEKHLFNQHEKIKSEKLIFNTIFQSEPEGRDLLNDVFDNKTYKRPTETSQQQLKQHFLDVNTYETFGTMSKALLDAYEKGEDIPQGDEYTIRNYLAEMDKTNNNISGQLISAYENLIYRY